MVSSLRSSTWACQLQSKLHARWFANLGHVVILLSFKILWFCLQPSCFLLLLVLAGAGILYCAVTGPPDVTDLRVRLAALESAASGALQNVGFVRFNAFPDVGSELSYALAVVDGRGDGFVMSSIYSREEVRTYAKAVTDFAADKEVSAEEREALRIARARSNRR